MVSARNGRWVAAVAVACLTATLAGCGDTTDGSSDGNSSSESPVSTLRVGMDISYPPLEFYEGDTPTGIDVDIANALAEEMGVPVKLENIGFDSLITSLQSDRIDLIISGLKDLPERQETLNLIDYFQTNKALIVKKGNPKHITSLETMCGNKVGQVSGTTTLTEVQEASKSCEGAPIEVLTFASNSDVNLAIKAGRVDANLEDEASLSYVAQTSGDGADFELVTLPPTPNQFFGIATLKSNTEVTDAVLAAYEAIYEDGTLENIYQEWEVPSALPEAVLQNTGEE